MSKPCIIRTAVFCFFLVFIDSVMAQDAWTRESLANAVAEQVTRLDAQLARMEQLRQAASGLPTVAQKHATDATGFAARLAKLRAVKQYLETAGPEAPLQLVIQELGLEVELLPRGIVRGGTAKSNLSTSGAVGGGTASTTAAAGNRVATTDSAGHVETRSGSSTVTHPVTLAISYQMKPDIYVSSAAGAQSSWCTNRAVTHDSRIWSIRINAELNAPNFEQLANGRVLFSSQEVAFLAFNDEASSVDVELSRGGSRIPGVVRITPTGDGIIAFDKLTLNEAASVLDMLRDSAQRARLESQFATLSPNLVRVVGAPAEMANPRTLAGRVLDQIGYRLSDEKLARALNATVQRSSLPGAQITTSAIDILEGQLKKGVYESAPAGIVALLAAKKQPITAGQSEQQNFVILDEPCIFFSVAPIFAADKVTTGVHFRVRRDHYFDNEGTWFLKFRAEGDAADNVKYFQRVLFSGDFGANTQWTGKKFLVSPSAHAEFALTRGTTGTPLAGQRVDEWRAGGQLKAMFPVIPAFELCGADSRATLSADFSGVGGNLTPTDVSTKGQFNYCFRPAKTQFYVDLKADGGWASGRRFDGRSSFSFFTAKLRYRVSDLYDFLGQYQCGRKSPDYRKVCGWTSGINLVQGR